MHEDMLIFTLLKKVSYSLKKKIRNTHQGFKSNLSLATYLCHLGC